MAVSLAKDQGAASTIMDLLMFPMMFLSGLIFPIQQMPWIIQEIFKVESLTCAGDAMRKIMLLNAMRQTYPPIYYIIGFRSLHWLLNYCCSVDQ